MKTNQTNQTRRYSTHSTRSQAHEPARRTTPDDQHNDNRAEVDVAPELSKRLQHTIDGLKADWRSYLTHATPFFESRDALATRFMKAYESYKSETGLYFVDFVRLFDPAVPKDAEGYKRHTSYNAADYLRRKVAATRKPKPKEAGPKPASPMDALARMVAVVLPLITADQVTRLWEAVDSELHWSQRQVESLQARVKGFEEAPLVNLRPLRGMGGTVPQLRIAATHRASEASGKTGTHG